MPRNAGGRGRSGARGGGAATTQSRKTFDEFFTGVFGKKRWATLRVSMVSTSQRKVALVNRYAGGVVVKEQEPVGDMGAKEKDNKDADTTASCPVPALEGLQRAPSRQLQLYAPANNSDLIPPPTKEAATATSTTGESSTTANILPYYIFDYASALVVEQLQVEPINKVLDLCAAPGGKSVAIAQFLNQQGGGHLTANEMSGERCARLKRTLADHLPKDASPPYEAIQKDGTRYHAPAHFDRILLDAPCSGERHLLHGAGGFVVEKDWTPAYTQKMAAAQKSLLLRALEMLRVGGRMTYSTCSISPQENDEVVQYALERTRCHVKLEETELRIGESTGLGWIILPDVCDGAGPMYVATISKVGEHRPQDSSSEDDDDSDEE